MLWWMAHIVCGFSRSLGLLIEILHLTTKLQWNRNFQKEYFRHYRTKHPLNLNLNFFNSFFHISPPIFIGKAPSGLSEKSGAQFWYIIHPVRLRLPPLNEGNFWYVILGFLFCMNWDKIFYLQILSQYSHCCQYCKNNQDLFFISHISYSVD